MQPKILQGEVERPGGVYYQYDPLSTPLGEGGMGVVYKGLCVNACTGTRHVVAIKAMKDGLPDEVYERARREAGIRLKNDNLVEMLGFISTTEQEIGCTVRRYYVISEFVNGVVLTDLLNGRFTDCDGIEVPFARQLYNNFAADRKSTAVLVIKRVLAGIMALHDLGFIHRDIDPSNIMVTKEGNLKMIDFGIAKDIRNLSTQDGLHTATGKFIGKAGYAAPELVLGDVSSQNFTTDVYAIGILFYQLLVGSLPFEGAQYDVLQRQLRKKVPVGNIPYSEYRPVVRRATAKDQASRYQSCAEFRAAIDSVRPSNIKAIVAGPVIVVAALIAFFAYLVLTPADPVGQVEEEAVELVENLDGNSIDGNLFDSAMDLLRSDDPDVVWVGWHEMKHLADGGDKRAKVEVGTTYFADATFGDLSDELARRRRALNLVAPDTVAVMRMLRDIKDDDVMTGEAQVALGIIYWRLGDFDNGRYHLRKSLPRLRDTNGKLLRKVEDKLK